MLNRIAKFIMLDKKLHFFALLIVAGLCIPIASARDVDKDRLKIALKIFPRLMAVDLDIQKKLTKTNELSILIFYRTQKSEAEEIAEYFNTQVRLIAKIPVKFSVVNKLPKESPAGIMIVERLDHAELNSLIQYGIKNQILVFSPYEEDVKKGVTAGMSIHIRITPCFNQTTLKRSRIRIHNIILKSSELYE